MDSWPAHLKRRVSMHLTRLQAAVDACADGHLLAALPDYAVSAYANQKALRRLPIDVVPSTTYYAVQREMLVPGTITETIINAFKEQVKKVLVGSPRRRGS